MNQAAAKQEQRPEDEKLEYHPKVHEFVGGISDVCRQLDILKVENAELLNRVKVAEAVSAQVKTMLESVTKERDAYMRVTLTMTTRMDDARGLLDKMYADMKTAATQPETTVAVPSEPPDEP